MTFTTKKFLLLAAVLGIAIGGLSLNTPAEAQTPVPGKSFQRSMMKPKPMPGHAVPGRLIAVPGTGVLKKDIWGDPDAFLAKCHDAGGGASTDEDGFPHCADSNGGTIIIPMEE